MKLSIVIPVFNEEENIKPMLDVIKGNIESIEHEIIFVDDGSTDDTISVLQKETKNKNNIRIIAFTRNFGQTSAMAAGIEAASGEFIATLDGDLQNDPSDIPMMLDMLEKKKLDIIAGRRANRKDGMYLRKIPSKIANWLIRKITNVHIHDYGCTLKVFRTSIAKRMDLYGELHRFIPILGAMEGAKIKEVDVKHHARKYGSSKYGLNRTFKVISDLLLMVFFLKYRQKPMHFFGTFGIGMFFLGGIIEVYLLLHKIMGNDIGHRPLFYVGILLLIAGIQFVTAGFLADLLMRTYFGSQNKRPYNIKQYYKAGKEE